MTSRVSSKNKEGKIVLKKETKQKKKTIQRNRKQRRRESNPVCLHIPNNILTTAPQRLTVQKVILSYQNNFSLP